MSWATVNIVVTCLAYGVSTVLFLGYLLSFHERWMRLGRGALVVAATLHAVAIVHLVVLPSEVMPAVDAAFIASFIVVLAYFGIGVRRSIHMAGPFLAPMVTVVLYSVWEGMRQTSPVSAEVMAVITPLHIAASSLGLLAFLAAFDKSEIERMSE